MSEPIQGQAIIPATVNVGEQGPAGDPLRGQSATVKMVATLGVTGVICVIVVLLVFNLMKAQDKPGELAERLIDKMISANKDTVHEFKDALKERELVTRDWMKTQGDRNENENNKTRAENAANHDKTRAVLEGQLKVLERIADKAK